MTPKTKQLSTKEKILAIMGKLDDEATLDQAIHSLVLLKKLENSREQIKQGKYVDHDELFDRLISEDEKGQNNMVEERREGSSKGKKLHH
jgi:hypothetical protein